MIVRNEAKNIKTAIKNFSQFADEIIVNDTGSTDQTISILNTLNITLIQNPWCDDFSLARNQSLAVAHGSWCLILDADEHLPDASVEKINRLKQKTPDTCFDFQVINLQDGHPTETTYPQTRMFPNHDNLCFSGRVNEQILPACETLGLQHQVTDIILWHCGYDGSREKKEKIQRNIAILNQSPERPHNPDISHQEGDSWSFIEAWQQAAEAYEYCFNRPGCNTTHPAFYQSLPLLIGRSYQILNHHTKALDWFKKGLDINPKSIELYFYTGELLYMTDQWDACKSYLKHICQLDIPADHQHQQHDMMRVYSFHYLCQGCIQKKQWTQATAYATAFHQAYPQLYESNATLGKALLKQQQPNEAATYLKTAMDIDDQADPELGLLLEQARIQSDHKAEPNTIHQQQTSPLPRNNRNTAAMHLVNPLISICMIVKNEINNLPACLQSIAPLGDEIVIIDTGSNDGTLDYLKQKANTDPRYVIGEFSWCDDFSKARNYSLSLATGQWIVWFDADDVMETDQLPLLRQHIQNTPPCGMLLRVKNTQDMGVTGTVFTQLRVFPNDPAIRFIGAVHEEVFSSLTQQQYAVNELSVRVLHTGYANQDIMTQKQQRNLTILLKQHHDNPNLSTAVDFYSIGGAYQDLKAYHEAIGWFRKASQRAEKRHDNPHIQEGGPIKMIECLIELKDFKEALTMINQFQKQRQNNPEVIRLKAEILMALKQTHQANTEWLKLFYFQESNSLLPIDYQKSQLTALLNLSQYFKAQGNNDNMEQLSLAFLRSGKSILEKQTITFQQVFDLLFNHHAYDYALSLVKYGLQFQPDAWHYLAATNCCIKLNKTASAKQYLKKGKKKYPDDPRLTDLQKHLKNRH